MKWAFIIGAVGAAAVAVLAAIFVPDLLAANRFERALDRHAADYRADGGPWPQIQDSCALCHGARGQSRNARYASLAGLSAAYVEAQLHAFADGRRRSIQMGPIAAELSGPQIKMLAAYFARQAPDRNEVAAVDSALEPRGRAVIAAQNCATCHGDRLAGSTLAPRLAGQGEIYLSDQLTAFKRGTRQDPTQAMNAMANALSEDDIKIVARYAAGLPPTTK